MLTSETTLYLLLTGIITFTIGIILGRFLLRKLFKKLENDANDRAKNILNEAELRGEVIKKEKLIEAKDQFNKLKSETESEINRRKNIAIQNEQKLKQRDQQLNQKLNEIKRKEDEMELMKNRLQANTEQLAKRKEDVEKLHQQEVSTLEKISNLSAEQATQQLVETLKGEAKTKAASFALEYLEEAKLSAQKDAKKIIIQTIQRLATEAAIENSVSVFHLESEEMKGRIIGREGRNVRTLEAATGVEIIVDDTPDAIVISCFDSIRREIARLSLHRLVADGRIHPARIEEVVDKVSKSIHEEIIQIGEKTCIDLGIHGLHPELSKLVGRMRYRASYGQNLLHHSRETAHLCAIMAGELHVNPKLAIRAGLLHDIGKVYFEDPETPHALLGMQLAQKYNENPIICNAIGAHHDEIEMTNIISPIVQACDAISGARPGARREVTDMYNKRIKDLEDLAMTYQGVNKSFAIQAGRELRVIVEAEVVNDQQAQQISNELATKIQTDMQYPGQIKITVIRETRAVAIAK